MTGVGDHDDFDWEGLRAQAVEAMGHAYAPYSQLPGGRGRPGRGRPGGDGLQRGERGLRRHALRRVRAGVSQLHITGGGRLTHFVCVDGAGSVIMPCGRCRQLLWENGGAELLLWTVSGVRPMTEVLPDAFGPEDLHNVEEKNG